MISIWKKTKLASEVFDEQMSPVKIMTKNNYEDVQTLDDYKKFHFDNNLKLGVGNFPRAIANYCIRVCEKYNIPMISAIDCGAGPAG